MLYEHKYASGTVYCEISSLIAEVHHKEFKESQSTAMLCALKCCDCFVFRHFISHFRDERLISEARILINLDYS
jgi:hypothetical protein